MNNSKEKSLTDNMINKNPDSGCLQNLRLDFAPLEGITSSSFRNAHHAVFSGVSRYYAPFLITGNAFLSRARDRRDIDPAENQDIRLVPQLLTNSSREFLDAAEKLIMLGYSEVNLNLGCPSGTVVSHRRGSGFLMEPDRLDSFFEEVFDGIPALNHRTGRALHFSIKTRLGLLDPQESGRLLEIYNRYPFYEVIIHPRIRKEMYHGAVHFDIFLDLFRASRNPVCYNGDLQTTENIRNVYEHCRQIKDAPHPLSGIMLGRGAVRDPAIFRRARGGAPMNRTELSEFLNLVYRNIAHHIPESRNQLAKMKDIWAFLGQYFPEEENRLKRLRRAQSLEQFMIEERMLISEADFPEQ